MVAILGVSILIIYIIAGTGYAIVKCLTIIFIENDDFKWTEKCLIGTSALMTWFNIWSLVLPLNVSALVIPIIFASYFHYKYSRAVFSIPLSSTYFVPAVLLLITYLLFSVVPPYMHDSVGYHFNAIRWAETFKVVKGLANIISRLGFDSSYFTLSAPFTFSTILPEPVFVINFVLTVVFTFWIIEKCIQINNGWHKLLFFAVLLYSLRWLLVNLSSPSPDTLPGIFSLVALLYISYPLSANTKFNYSKFSFLAILTLSAFIAKLSSAFLIILVLVIAFYRLEKVNKKFLLTLFTISVFIIVPYLVRNVFISGYLIYPLYEVDLFNVDWKAPIEFAKYDRLLIQTGPRMIPVRSLLESQALSAVKWVPQWLLSLLHSPIMFLSLLLFLLSISTFCYYIILFKKLSAFTKTVWALNMFGVLFWLVSSPDFRFGYPFLLSTFFLGYSWLPIKLRARSSTVIIYMVTVLTSFYYIKQAYLMMPNDQAGLLTPTHTFEIFKTKRSNFPSINMSNNVRLYIADTTRSCLEAGLPCANDDFYPGFDIGTIKLRGTTIADGFKIVR